MGHRILLAGDGNIPKSGDTLAIGAEVEVLGPEAQHAVRVKRLEAGSLLELCNGQGLVAIARVTATLKLRGEWVLRARVEHVAMQPRPTPVLHVLAAAPKGDRLETMVDGLSQVGAATFAPLITQRSVVDPSGHKLDRLRRHAEESLKQCGRAWVLEVRDAIDFDAALASAASTAIASLVIADASGEPYTPTTLPAETSAVTLLVGPEGGFTPQELDAARARGARVVRFGQHIMRIEVAAVVAAAMLMHAPYVRA